MGLLLPLFLPYLSPIQFATAAAAVDVFPRSQAGSVIGLWTVFMGIGSVLSPIVCGWTIDVSNSYVPSFLLGFLTALLSALLLVPLKRLKKGERTI